MSKSLGNVVTPRQLMEGRAWAPGAAGAVAATSVGAEQGGGGGKGKGGKKPSSSSSSSSTTNSPPLPPLTADVLRYWVASSDFSRDVTIGPTVLSRTAEALRKVRNTARFLVGVTGGGGFHPKTLAAPNSEGLQAATDASWCPPPDALAAAWALPFPAHALLPRTAASPWPVRALDAAMLSQLAAVEGVVRGALEGLAFEKAAYAINALAARDLSANYCDAVKDRLYQEHSADIEVGGMMGDTLPPRLAAQAVLWEALRLLMRCLAPIAPFTAEEVYQASLLDATSTAPAPLPSASSSTIFHTHWHPFPPHLLAPAATSYLSPAAQHSPIPLAHLWGCLMGLRAAVQAPLEAARGAGLLGSAAEAAVTIFVAGEGGGGATAASNLLAALGAAPLPAGGSTKGGVSAAELEELLGVSSAQVLLLQQAAAWGAAAGCAPPPPPPPQQQQQQLLGGAQAAGAAVLQEGGWCWVSYSGEGGAAERLLVRVSRAGGAAERCARCWKYREEVARSESAVCGRCASVLERSVECVTP